MNRHGRRLRQIVHDLALECNESFGAFRRRYGLDEFWADILNDTDSEAQVAGKALFHLCTDGQAFNGSTLGLKSVLRFLAEVADLQPESDADVRACQLSLKEAMSDGFTARSLADWVRGWYSF